MYKPEDRLCEKEQREKSARFAKLGWFCEAGRFSYKKQFQSEKISQRKRRLK